MHLLTLPMKIFIFFESNKELKIITDLEKIKLMQSTMYFHLLFILLVLLTFAEIFGI